MNSCSGRTRRILVWVRRAKRYVIDAGRWNFALAFLALTPVAATFFAINFVVDREQLRCVLNGFKFDQDISAETVRALYNFGLAVAGFFLVVAVSTAVCVVAQYGAAPAGRRRRWGLYAAVGLAALFATLMMLEPWSLPGSLDSYRSPDFLFSEAFHLRASGPSPLGEPGMGQELGDTFDRVWLTFRLSIAVVVAAFTFAAAAAAACASPIKLHKSSEGRELKFIDEQIGRHHAVFYATSVTLLAMLFLGKARLDVYQAILNTTDHATQTGFRELRAGLEIYWGGILTLCLAMIYTPTALYFYACVNKAGRQTQDLAPDDGKGATPRRASPPAVAMRIALILLPTLFSGGVSELVKSVLEQ